MSILGCNEFELAELKVIVKGPMMRIEVNGEPIVDRLSQAFFDVKCGGILVVSTSSSQLCLVASGMAVVEKTGLGKRGRHQRTSHHLSDGVSDEETVAVKPRQQYTRAARAIRAPVPVFVDSKGDGSQDGVDDEPLRYIKRRKFNPLEIPTLERGDVTMVEKVALEDNREIIYVSSDDEQPAADLVNDGVLCTPIGNQILPSTEIERAAARQVDQRPVSAGVSLPSTNTSLHSKVAASFGTIPGNVKSLEVEQLEQQAKADSDLPDLNLGSGRPKPRISTSAETQARVYCDRADRTREERLACHLLVPMDNTGTTRDIHMQPNDTPDGDDYCDSILRTIENEIQCRDLPRYYTV
ncbi:hypothetical protein LTR62_001825 [Meristemomyces frigidus]|uniref:Uncharacterized protein n=1 Tax=Meristemomyces frigidus TaxID=1508187 RepID=A0AAN7YHX6_9PEZI|nr:hypothetical protein LTR62_001825 [Meristemomyces frigidus]